MSLTFSSFIFYLFKVIRSLTPTPGLHPGQTSSPSHTTQTTVHTLHIQIYGPSSQSKDANLRVFGLREEGGRHTHMENRDRAQGWTLWSSTRDSSWWNPTWYLGTGWSWTRHLQVIDGTLVSAQLYRPLLLISACCMKKIQFLQGSSSSETQVNHQ